jgi:hypothetical protein
MNIYTHTLSLSHTHTVGGSLGKDKDELIKLLSYVMPLLPKDKPNHLLGIADSESLNLKSMLIFTQSSHNKSNFYSTISSRSLTPSPLISKVC